MQFQSDKRHQKYQKQLEYLAAKMKKNRSPFTARKNKIKNARESPSENSEKCSASAPYKVADAENTIITAFTPKQLTDMPGTKSNKKKTDSEVSAHNAHSKETDTTKKDKSSRSRDSAATKEKARTVEKKEQKKER